MTTSDPIADIIGDYRGFAAMQRDRLMARDKKYSALFAVSEGLLDHDEAFIRWRAHHVLMVEREIGANCYETRM